MINRGSACTAGRYSVFLWAFAFWAVMTGLSYPALRPENFTYFAEIQGDLRRDQLYRLELGKDVLGRCEADCRDIRLFDSDGSEVPYVIVEHRIAGVKTVSYSLETIEFREEGNKATLTLKTPDRAEPVSVIRIETPDRDFRVSCSLSGSHDLKAWTGISDDILYDFSSQVALRKTDLRFSVSDYRYYRLVMSYADLPGTHPANAPGIGQEQLRLKYNGLDFSVAGVKAGKIRISGIRAETSFEGSGETLYDEARYEGFSFQPGRKNETALDIRTGLPFDRVYLDISNPYYYRRVRTSFIGKGGTGRDYEYPDMIYRFPVASREESKPYIDVSGNGGRDYRIIIENNNSAPLDISGIRLAWKRRYLFFIPLRDSRGYTLSVGSEAAEAPVYDLGRFVNQANWHGLKALEVRGSGLVRTAAFRPAEKEDRKSGIEKAVLVSLVVLLVIGMGIWLYLLMKKTPGKDS